MIGHTPGPWKVADDGSPFVYALNTTGTNRMSAPVNPGWHDDRSSTSYDERVANARLIAAAPDMHEANALALTALEDLWRAYMSDTHPNLEQMNDAMKALRAAIANATHGAP